MRRWQPQRWQKKEQIGVKTNSGNVAKPLDRGTTIAQPAHPGLVGQRRIEMLTWSELQAQAAGQIVVRCRETGVMDANGRPIYEAENGQVFVFWYRGSSAEYFDSGCLRAPTLSEED
jgi:hypothetical protein